MMKAALTATQTQPQPVSLLTAREIDVLSLLARGYTYSGIGEQLGISRHTVTSHIKNSYRKLAVRSGPAAVTRAAELGLLQLKFEMARVSREFAA